jgi:hypothetical protein
MQLSTNMFLTLISTVPLFSNTLAMPLEKGMEDRGLSIQCGRLWTSIGLCRIGDTFYSLNSDYCSSNCYCGGRDGKGIICPNQYGACTGEDVADHCTRYHCVCE